MEERGNQPGWPGHSDHVGRANGATGSPENNNGELAQLARASALHAEGQRFESVILHEWMGKKRGAGEPEAEEE